MLHLEPRAYDAARFSLRGAAGPCLGDPCGRAPGPGPTGWVVAS